MSERFDCSDAVAFESGLTAAVDAVRAGELVVLPTDTVYGVGADAFAAEAVQRLLTAKGRTRQMPPPVLVPSLQTLEALTIDVPAYARAMVEELWPGALTLVCHEQPSLTWDLGVTRQTVAVRMPDDENALAVLQRTGPLAVSSANRTGRAAARTVDEAQDMLGESVAVYLDGGPAPIGEASTIVDITGPAPRILRAGAIDAERIRTFNSALEVLDGGAD